MEDAILPFLGPTTIYIAGGTQSGKTTFVKRLLSNGDRMISPPPDKIVYAHAGVWQPAYDEMERVLKYIKFHEGLPSTDELREWCESGKHTVLVLDDLLQSAVSSPDMLALFTVHSHHFNLTTILLSHNVFMPGKYSRTISLNSHYIILFENQRDSRQIQTLGRQIFAGKSSYFPDAYKKAVSERYGYLLVDLNPRSDKLYQLRSRIFPGEITTVYAPK